MDTIQAEQGLRLTYLRDPLKCEAFDPCCILDDLCEDGMAEAMLPRRNGLRMAESDHLVLAISSDDGRCCGAVAASDRATAQEPFLFLDAAYLAQSAHASHLLQRMLAFAMLRIAGDAAVPSVIAACVQTPWYAHSLSELDRRFTGAARFPAAPDAVVIDLCMASLARRIARIVRPGSRYEAATGVFCAGAARHDAGIPFSSSSSPHRMEETLVVIDLSPVGEAAILDAARKLYRASPKSRVRHAVADAVAGAASAPRRGLRDATAL